MDYPIDATALQSFVDATDRPTREQMREDLARAMWPEAEIEPSSTGDDVDIRIYDKPNETQTWYGFDPFTNHADCHALVCWLNQQPDDIRDRFNQHYMYTLINPVGTESSNIVDVLVSLASDPVVKAEAAWRAIQSKSAKNNEEK